MEGIYIREFEFYESEGFVLTRPCDMEGGAFGESMDDVARSAADWLYETVADDLAHGRTPKGGKLGNEPQHGGRVITVVVDCRAANR